MFIQTNTRLISGTFVRIVNFYFFCACVDCGMPSFCPPARLSVSCYNFFLLSAPPPRKNMIELVKPGGTGQVVWRSRQSLVNTVKQSVGAKLSSWLLRRKSDEQPGTTSEPFPPKAIAGLYLRETSDHRLAIMSSNSNDLGREDGHDVTNGREGADHGDQGMSGVEFGVVLEGDSVGSEAEKGRDVGGVNGRGETLGDEGSPGMKNSGPLGEGAGIEMMELGGEWLTLLFVHRVRSLFLLT